jgi:polar amino acid transport system substrate-binding protein
MSYLNGSLTPIIVAGLALSSCAHMRAPDAATVTPALRAEFAPSGTLVAGVNFGNVVIAMKDPAGGDPRGVGPELARELARRLGVPIRYVTYDNAGPMANAVKQGAWDVAMLAVDPARGEDIAFSAPYVVIEASYMVRPDSPLTRLDEFDRKGLRIAVGSKTAYELWLARNLKNAELVQYPTSQAAIDAFLGGKTDVVAGVRQALLKNAGKQPGLRVIDGSYMTIGQASGVPRARANAAQYLRDFIEEAKASGIRRAQAQGERRRRRHGGAASPLGLDAPKEAAAGNAVQVIRGAPIAAGLRRSAHAKSIAAARARATRLPARTSVPRRSLRDRSAARRRRTRR